MDLSDLTRFANVKFSARKIENNWNYYAFTVDKYSEICYFYLTLSIQFFQADNY